MYHVLRVMNDELHVLEERRSWTTKPAGNLNVQFKSSRSCYFSRSGLAYAAQRDWAGTVVWVETQHTR